MNFIYSLSNEFPILSGALFLIIGFYIMIQSASLMVDASMGLAKKLKLSEGFVGLTLVAFGTSAPELFSSSIASFQGQSELAYGNIVGSNIFNFLFVLGLSSLFLPIKIDKISIKYYWPGLVLFSLLVFIFSITDLTLNNIEGIIMCLCYFGFIYWVSKKDKNIEKPSCDQSSKSFTFLALFVSGSILFLAGGAKLTLMGANQLGQQFGMTEKLIGLTIVSIGTGLPELITSIVAAIKKFDDVAVTNVLGSNLINLLVVGGTASIINPLKLSSTIVYQDYVFHILAFCLFIIPIFFGKKLNHWKSLLFLLSYIGYMIFAVQS